ncbi:MAG: hypothetical protein GXO88_00455 [Chlorobi bacterium]|nr:hypothetical protein [Chlorobiota bacterium]
MEDILTYVIVFGLIIGGVAVWQIRYAKPRPYWLSHQLFPEMQMWVLIEKKDGKHKSVIIKTMRNKNLSLHPPKAELINSKRERLIIDLAEKEKQERAREDGQIETITGLDFDEFYKLLNSSEFKFSTFRIIVENDAGKRYKSQELAFNKRWTIYRPDSGKYN